MLPVEKVYALCVELSRRAKVGGWDSIEVGISPIHWVKKIHLSI